MKGGIFRSHRQPGGYRPVSYTHLDVYKRQADINGREEEIATAVGKCMSDVSLDMMLRMYVQPEIPGLFDVLSQHYKELKAALE